MDHDEVLPLPTIDRFALGLIVVVALALRLWYGAFWPHQGRFYDERFSFENVEAVFVSGKLTPAHGYYPTLGWLPHTLLLVLMDRLHEVGWSSIAVRDGDRFTSEAWIACRWLQAVIGSLSLVLAHRLGLLLGGRAVGIGTALILAFIPWHIHSSAYFKPDIALLTTTLLAFLWGLRARRNPTLFNFALAGAGVTLVVSCKLSGGIVALPMAIVLWPLLRPMRQGIARVATAASSSIAVYYAMNPSPYFYLWYLQVLRNEYARKDGGASWINVFFKGLGFTAESMQPVLATAAAAGVALLLYRLARRPHRDAGVYLAVVAYPFVFCFAYACTTRYYKSNNFLPLLPFLSLFATTALVALERNLRPGNAGRRIPRGGIVLIMLLVLLVPRGFNYVYGCVVPSTYDVAMSIMAGEFGKSAVRRVVQEGHTGDLLWERAHLQYTAATRVVERLTALGDSELDRTDAEVFPRSRLLGPDRADYERRIAQIGLNGARYINPIPFKVRGPRLLVLLHAWQQTESFTLTPESAPDGAWLTDLESPEPSTQYRSLLLWLPMPWVEPPIVEVDGRRVRVDFVFHNGGGYLAMSDRFQWATGARIVPNAKLSHIGLQSISWSAPIVDGAEVGSPFSAPPDAPRVIARIAIAGSGAWTMAGAPYAGRVQSDHIWTVDPFLSDWDATTVSLPLVDALPPTDRASLEIELRAFCRSPDCNPTLELRVGDQHEELPLLCTESWQTYKISDINVGHLSDQVLSIDPPTVGPEILLLGTVELTLRQLPVTQESISRNDDH